MLNTANDNAVTADAMRVIRSAEIAANTIRHTGAKYDRSRDLAEIARLVRADIKAAVKSGALPADLKASVTISRYSMGQSMRVSLTAPSVVVPSVARVRADLANPHGHVTLARHTVKARAVVATVESLVKAYQRSETESQSDVCNFSFYDTVEFSDAQESAQRAEIVATLRAAYAR